ncbi:helicase HerA domain-containing protein [Actinotalea sp. K2]|uniref:helicase HerA domain-containing protein n=1 Tax=Actinotalea sp. K2 TaxID=2939438 RepID=UPI00201789FE|nr:DUF87 domain-containing protein [Actinotalea sp. K2]MCL3862945.1 ATP-binding protein [Actinotalea sp. K2]
MTDGTSVLADALADELERMLSSAADGHCVRVDDIDERLAAHLARDLAGRVAGADVLILRSKPQLVSEVAPERAIELRNRKLRPLLLLVPLGEGGAASSLDNSFERRPALDIFKAVEGKLRDQLLGSAASEGVAQLRAARRGQAEAWAEFLSALCVAPTEETLGHNLWRIGLVPDLGPEPSTRLASNAIATKAISRPTRPTSSLDERFNSGGLADGPWRGSLRAFCQAQQLTNPHAWGRQIAEARPDLSFHLWQLAEAIKDDLERLELEPFLLPDGRVARSGLKLGDGGELTLEVPEGQTASLTVAWKTHPAKVAAVHSWRLEVLPPSDMREEDPEPLALQMVKGDKRRGTVKVALEDDALSSGNRFVVSLTAVGEHGEPVNLVDGSSATADSQEFQILLGGEPPSPTRRSAAVSLPEAAVRAALDGMDELTEDQVTWDLPGQVFGLRLGNRRAVQIRVSAVVIDLQRRAVEAADRPMRFQATGSYGSVLAPEAVEARDLLLPRAVKRARTELLTLMKSRFPRNTVESLSWDDEVRALVSAYLAAYRRALESAEDRAAIRELLLLDGLSLSVRRSNTTVNAVVLSPLHPLRLAWVGQHDAALRGWANSLVGLMPKQSRKAQVDVDLMSRVVASNCPFTVVDGDDRLAVYAEELTHGAGLYLVPGDSDSEAAAEAVVSVLGLERKGSALVASSGLVAERLRAYEMSHDPGEALRVLAIRPGAGQMLSGALEEFVRGDGLGQEEGSTAEDPHRLEVTAYTDSAAYSRPVPALLSLQHALRDDKFERGSNHLLPPLAVAVRPTDRLLEDAQAAHLALVQDVGRSRVGWSAASPRAASFGDLLVPVTTSRREGEGGLVWESVPVTGSRPARNGTDLAGAHGAHQRALGRMFGREDGAVPAVQVVLDGDHLAQNRSVHERADWVVSVDRFVGVDLYESPRSGDSDAYILDYAPDFVEGIGDRLTVTTAHRAEVEHLLASAMTDLGLHEVTHSVGSVLSTLAVVSGRLALRLIGDTSRAREAVSLAAVISHLRETGELDGQIVIPVDAHNEIFGAGVRDENDGTRRCDLLLVRVGQRSFKIECLEVKSRQEARLPQALADIILDQLTDTRRLLESRFFASDPPRVDGELQRARLASLLHYYADRSKAHGLIDASKLPDIHRYIDRIEESGEPAEISLRGFVISLNGNHGMKKKYGDVPMTVLTAGDLGRLGFTTRAGGPDTGHHEVPAVRQGDAQLREATPEEVPPNAPREEGGGRDTELPVAGPPPDTGSDPYTGRSDADRGTPEREGSEDGRPAGGASSQPTKSGALDDAEPAHPRHLAVALGQTSTGSEVVWNLSTQGSPHALIVGIPGQGKSVTTRRIIGEFARQGLPSLVFDFHGDMAAAPPQGARVIDAALGLPFSPFEPEVGPGKPINTVAWQIAEIIGFVAQLGRIQQNHVYKALVQAYAAHGWVGTTPGSGVPSMQDFAEAIEAVEKGAQGKNARERLSPLTDFGLFADDTAGSFDALTGGDGVVVDLSRLGLEEVQTFGAAFVLRRVYREMFAWGQSDQLRLGVVLDEAHRMAKDPTLPLLMKEGRKFGVSVVVASQSVEDFHDDILRNVGAKIIFRTNYPASRKVAGLLRGRGDADLSAEIEKLGVGAAYVSTPDETRARRVYMTK